MNGGCLWKTQCPFSHTNQTWASPRWRFGWELHNVWDCTVIGKQVTVFSLMREVWVRIWIEWVWVWVVRVLVRPTRIFNASCVSLWGCRLPAKCSAVDGLFTSLVKLLNKVSPPLWCSIPMVLLDSFILSKMWSYCFFLEYFFSPIRVLWSHWCHM
jgi:hypothetical protein